MQILIIVFNKTLLWHIQNLHTQNLLNGIPFNSSKQLKMQHAQVQQWWSTSTISWAIHYMQNAVNRTDYGMGICLEEWYTKSFPSFLSRGSAKKHVAFQDRQVSRQRPLRSWKGSSKTVENYILHIKCIQLEEKMLKEQEKL